MTAAKHYGAVPADWANLDILAGLGGDLLPVVSNPKAVISPGSTMQGLGKTPSRYNGARNVAGIAGWSKHIATATDIARWSREPDYGICIQCREVRAIDIDVDDQAVADRIARCVQDAAGIALPVRRRSNSGKCLLAFRMPGEFSKRKMKVEGGVIELLATGQQFIAVGTHPSGVPYEWEGGLPDEFPKLTAAQFEDVWATLGRRFAIEEVRPAKTQDAAATITPPGAVAIDTMAAALATIPNTGIDELAYDDWLMVMMALHYETGTSHEGLALAHEFSAKASKYSADEVELEWGRIKGASHGGKAVTGRSILHLARERYGWVESVEDAFDVVVPQPDPDPETGEAAPEPRPAFLRKPKTGEILVTMDNMTKALDRPDMVGLRIAYDTFRDEIMHSTDDGENWQSFKDADYTRLRIALERCGFQPPSKDATRDAVLLVAERNTFDSAQVWLGRLQWDGVPRVDAFLSSHFGAEDTPYTRAVGRYIWTALAGRVIEPGCKADMAPILVGKQGARKSSGVAAMAPDPRFFTEISFGEKEDDLSRKMRGRLVAELAELKGLGTRDSEAIKAWMTKQYEDWTPKYREFNTVFPRRLLCFGTTNKPQFLVDETGNRRWLPVRIDGLADVERIKRDCLQLWAEAALLFTASGVDFHDAETLAMDQHAEYMVQDGWMPYVERWLNTPDMMTDEIPATREFLQVHDVLEGAIKMDAKSCKRADEMRIGDILRALGYERKQKRLSGKPAYLYYTPLA